MHGIANEKGDDPRLGLESLPDQQLFDIGKTPDGVHRKLAVELLVQRCSKFIRRPEIADEVEALLATTPARSE